MPVMSWLRYQIPTQRSQGSVNSFLPKTRQRGTSRGFCDYVQLNCPQGIYANRFQPTGKTSGLLYKTTDRQVSEKQLAALAKGRKILAQKRKASKKHKNKRSRK